MNKRLKELSGGVFQSTPPYGGRLDKIKELDIDKGFQSTPPYGGRHLMIAHGMMFNSFNPRPRMGGDIHCQ